MIILNPQWQGSGKSSQIKTGAEIIAEYFDKIDEVVELSDSKLDKCNNILAYFPIYEQLKSFRKIIENNKPEFITTIGGDCGIEIIPVSYLNSKYENLGIIWLDAHADLNTPESSPSKTFHGMPLRLLLGEGDKQYKELLFSTIETSQILYIGLRDTDEAEKEYITANNIFSQQKIDYLQVKQKLIKQNVDKVYIHLDFDVLDPKEFPYTKCPTPNGLSTKYVEYFISMLQTDFEVVGQSLCESIAKNTTELVPITGILDRINRQL